MMTEDKRVITSISLFNVIVNSEIHLNMQHGCTTGSKEMQTHPVILLYVEDWMQSSNLCP